MEYYLNSKVDIWFVKAGEPFINLDYETQQDNHLNDKLIDFSYHTAAAYCAHIKTSNYYSTYVLLYSVTLHMPIDTLN